MSFELVNGGSNCTHFTVNAVETTFLFLILLYIVILNIFVIFITIGSAELRGCLFSMQLAASYLGNMFGGLSLLVNDIYYSGLGIPPVCQTGEDLFFFLYFGNALNMVILLLNTRYRYQGITSIKRMNSKNLRSPGVNRSNIAVAPGKPTGGRPPVKTKDVVWKVWIPALLFSLCICIVATLLQKFVIRYQFLISIGICILPLGFSIVWNVLLTLHFQKGLTNSKYLNRSQSIRVLRHATFIIHTTVLAHSIFLVVCTCAVVCSLYYSASEGVVKGTSWLLRVFYLMLFTVEGHVYLYKVDVARKVIKRKFLKCFGCKYGGDDHMFPPNVGYTNQRYEPSESTHSTPAPEVRIR